MFSTSLGDKLMILQDILSSKGNTVYTVPPGTKLDEVAHTLIERRIGSLVVARQTPSGEKELLGVVTERDILYHCAKSNLPLAAVEVTTVMGTPLVTASPSDTVEHIMGLMTEKRIRHLPVVYEGRLVGLVSIGDIVKAQHDNLAMENQFMKDYIRS